MRAIWVLVVGLSLAGCSLLVPKLETPRLSIVDVELLKSDLWQQRLKVRMRVQNPNHRALPVKGLSYTLEVAGKEFAHGESGASFVVPALGEAEVGLLVPAHVVVVQPPPQGQVVPLHAEHPQGTQLQLLFDGLVQQVVQGLGTLATLHLIDEGDHSFRVPKRTGKTEADIMNELAEATATWATGL